MAFRCYSEYNQAHAHISVNLHTSAKQSAAHQEALPHSEADLVALVDALAYQGLHYAIPGAVLMNSMCCILG